VTQTMRYVCPLACGWTREQGVPVCNYALGGTTDEIVQDALMKSYAADEIFIREHLETHALLEWAQALQAARDERDRWRRKAEAEAARLGDLLGAVRERAETVTGEEQR